MTALNQLQAQLQGNFKTLGPGLLLCATIATAAGFLSDHYGGPVMLFALLLGMAFNFLAAEQPCADGISFASKSLLRIGIALLGVRITFSDMAMLGLETVFAGCGLLELCRHFSCEGVIGEVPAPTPSSSPWLVQHHKNGLREPHQDAELLDMESAVLVVGPSISR